MSDAYEARVKERCSKYASMLKATCAHCQGPVRGTAENPVYSLKEHDVDGYPVVEVLKNGGAVHRYDTHFRFGRRKAEMLLACLSQLREFGWASEEDQRQFKPGVVEDRSLGMKIQIYVEMRPDFEYSTGTRIDCPWLCLQTIRPAGDCRIGLGMMKCRAVWAVREDLRAWVRSCDARAAQLLSDIKSGFAAQ